MNAERLLELYERVADAPDAIARLRRFVLDLAVRGRLVEQDPDDEPASELLKRITETRNALSKAKMGNSTAVKPTPFDGELYGLPEGWEWAALAFVADVTMGQSPPGSTYNTYGDGVPLINGPVEFTPGPFGKTVVNQFTTAPTNFCEEGDLLICVRGSTTGRTNIAAFKACIGRGVAAISALFEDGFIRLFLWKSREDIIAMGRGIAFPSISKKQLESLAIPLPPLPEQHRIVAKVDELMALLDRLEAARTTSEATRDRLTAASLARLTAPDTTPEAFPAHARFALDALSGLTTRPDQIKSLRQTILNLAVRGKLVEQNPEDEPASELLKRITVDIENYIHAHGVRAAKTARISDEDQPFVPPSGWRWTRLSNLCRVVTDGDHQPPPRSEDGIAFLTIGNVTTGKLEFVGCRRVPPQYFESLPAYRTPAVGDLLYTVVGATFGRPVLVDVEEPFCVQRHIAILKPSEEVFVPFLHRVLASPFVYEQAASATTGAAQPTIALKPLRNFLIPLPPLSEQHRIVARVDELMALCDRLEVALYTADTTKQRLLEALLHEALAPAATPRETEAA